MRCSILILFLWDASLFAQQSPVPEIRYRSVPDFLKLPPDLYFGEVAGVNSKGHVFVFSRGNITGPAYGASAALLLKFGADGKFLREIGHNLYKWSYAHTVKRTVARKIATLIEDVVRGGRTDGLELRPKEVASRETEVPKRGPSSPATDIRIDDQFKCGNA